MSILLGIALIVFGYLLLCCIRCDYNNSISQDVGLALIRLVSHLGIGLGTCLAFCGVMSILVPFIQQLLNL